MSFSMKTSLQDRQLGTRAECLVSLGVVGDCIGNNNSKIVEAKGTGSPRFWGIDWEYLWP